MGGGHLLEEDLLNDVGAFGLYLKRIEKILILSWGIIHSGLCL